MQNVIKEVLVGIDNVKSEIVSDIGALSSPKIRTILHRVAARVPTDESYVEIGTHIGGTLISALVDHKDVSAYCCDNWSFQTCNEGPVRDVFKRNLDRYKHRLPDVQVLDMDAFKMLQNPPFKKPVGAYFYDADHSEESQYKAITMIYPYLASDAVVIIDDWGMPEVQSGTWRGIKEVRPKELFFWGYHPKKPHDASDFWNGIGLFWLKKA